MGPILKLALNELKKKKFFALLMFLVSLIAMHTAITSITNAAGAAYQQKIFIRSLGYDMEDILHLDYRCGRVQGLYRQTPRRRCGRLV